MVKEKHKEKRTKDEIQAEVIIRLANYKTHRSEKRKKIDEWLKLGKKAGILKDFNFRNIDGWVFLDHIEEKPCPYGSPKTHRYAYLNNPMIEKRTFKYKVKKPNDVNYRIYTEDVYRLKRDEKTRAILVSFFNTLPGHINNLKVMHKLNSTLQAKFLSSDYYNETTNQNLKDLIEYRFLLGVLIAHEELKPTLKRDYKKLSEEGYKQSAQKFYSDFLDYSNKIQKQIKEKIKKVT